MKKKDHLNLLVDVGELQALLAGSGDFQNFLQQTTDLVAGHLQADVVSIYLYNESDETLTLEATHGLTPDAIGAVSLALGEGLVGMAMKELRPVSEGHASQNPKFKHFPGINEERFESFLAVPIRRGAAKIGVIVAQREETRTFSVSDSMALRATASQLASAIENGRALLDLHRGRPAPATATGAKTQHLPGFLRGQGASDAWCAGTAVVLSRKARKRRKSRRKRKSQSRKVSLADFDRAIKDTEQRILTLQERLKHKIPEMASLIFTAHVMMLKDPDFLGGMRSRIEAGEDAITVVTEVTDQYKSFFAASEQAYMREKADDVADLAEQLLGQLTREDATFCGDCEGRIVITRTLYPSHMLQLHTEGVQGIVLASGGATSHVSILARSLDIPLIICNDPVLFDIPDGTQVLLDGRSGQLAINPEPAVIEKVEAAYEQHAAVLARNEALQDPIRTADGESIALLANVNLLSELQLCNEIGVSGIGLYRSEFPFLVRNTFPSEEEQVAIYERLFDAMEGRVVTIRTLDIGGDKVLSYFDHGKEENPELGLRSIRFAMAHPDVFIQQLRAILRAAAEHEQLRIVFPMITALDEFEQTKSLLQTTIAALQEEGVACHSAPQVGMMVEAPSVVEIMPELVHAVDYFSIGTNDFIQYFLAVDRNNERVAAYYQAEHPGVLRALHRVIRIAAEAGKPLGVCGEMASDPRFCRFFIGSGARILSADPHHLHGLQEEINRIDLKAAQAHVEELLQQSTAVDIARLLES